MVLLSSVLHILKVMVRLLEFCRMVVLLVLTERSFYKAKSAELEGYVP
nr:MAG TPA: hypothetical protein [Caudoviricetes sp.]